MNIGRLYGMRLERHCRAIDWKLQAVPAVSAKDAQGKSLSEAELFA